MIEIAFEVQSSAGLEFGRDFGGADSVNNRVDIHVTGYVRNQISGFAGQEVDNATRKVAGSEDFRESRGRQRVAFRGDDNRRIAARNYWRNERNQRKQGR